MKKEKQYYRKNWSNWFLKKKQKNYSQSLSLSQTNSYRPQASLTWKDSEETPVCMQFNVSLNYNALSFYCWDLENKLEKSHYPVTLSWVWRWGECWITHSRTWHKYQPCFVSEAALPCPPPQDILLACPFPCPFWVWPTTDLKSSSRNSLKHSHP